LHRVAGRPEAVPLALAVVFDLPVAEVRVVSAATERGAGTATCLGGENARLGVDTVLDGPLPDESALEVRIGPIPLAAYLEHTKPLRRAQRDALYRLVLPTHLSRVEERWTVGDPRTGSRLGDGHEPAVLGVNCYLGAPPS
jgi:predicted component of type VI protein secretion system